MSFLVRVGGITSDEGITFTPYSILHSSKHNTEPHCIVEYSIVLYPVVENLHKRR